MIRYSNNRKECSGYDHGTVTRDVTSDKALESLIKYEMGYGGQILEVTDTKIVVQTRVLSKVDTVTFEGSKEEMEPLLTALAVWLEARQKISQDDLAKRVIQITGGKALYVTAAAGMIEGAMTFEKILDMLTAPGGGK